jgi:hypothetical protein
MAARLALVVIDLLAPVFMVEAFVYFSVIVIVFTAAYVAWVFRQHNKLLNCIHFVHSDLRYAPAS